MSMKFEEVHNVEEEAADQLFESNDDNQIREGTEALMDQLKEGRATVSARGSFLGSITDSPGDGTRAPAASLQNSHWASKVD